MSAASRFLERVGNLPIWNRIADRGNAILVKELRQSMRGRYFAVIFWLTLAIATMIGMMTFVFQDGGRADTTGTAFFLAMFGCLTFASNLFVPFAAFSSFGAEWEENTLELLLLSNLEPRQIILGKLLSAAVQTLLYTLAFGPFLVLAFLLRGLDLGVAFGLLLFVLLSSITLSAVAVMLSTLARHKVARALLMALMAVALVAFSFATVAFGSEQLFFSRSVFSDRFVLLVFLTIAAVVVSYCVAFGCTRLAHPEENRSTTLRVLTTCCLLALLGWAAFGFQESGGDDEVLYAFGSVAFLLLAVTSALFCSEPERLGRRVRLWVPDNRLLALLSGAFFPGGGRGTLYMVMNSALLIGGFAVVLGYAAPGFPYDQVIGFLLALTAYMFVYVNLPALLFSPFSKKLTRRIACRIAVPLFAFLVFFVPTVTAFALDLRRPFNHAGNPAWAMNEFAHGRADGALIVGLAIAFLVVLVFNLPRIGRGLGELVAEHGRRQTPGRTAAPESLAVPALALEHPEESGDARPQP